MNKRKIVNVVAEVLKYAILIAGAIFTLLPFLWMILSSLKTDHGYSAFLIPEGTAVFKLC